MGFRGAAYRRKAGCLLQLCNVAVTFWISEQWPRANVALVFLAGSAIAGIAFVGIVRQRRIADIRAFSDAIGFYSDSESWRHAYGRAQLMELVPLLTSDAAWQPSEQELVSVRELVSDPDPSLASGAIIALARLGDEATAPLLERLLSGPMPSELDPVVSAAAQQGLTILRGLHKRAG